MLTTIRRKVLSYDWPGASATFLTAMFACYVTELRLKSIWDEEREGLERRQMALRLENQGLKAQLRRVHGE